MDAEKVIECASCSTAVLCPDGAIRCSTDFPLAKLKCNEFTNGKPKIFKFDQARMSKIRKGKKLQLGTKRLDKLEFFLLSYYINSYCNPNIKLRRKYGDRLKENLQKEIPNEHGWKIKSYHNSSNTPRSN